MHLVMGREIDTFLGRSRWDGKLWGRRNLLLFLQLVHVHFCRDRITSHLAKDRSASGRISKCCVIGLLDEDPMPFDLPYNISNAMPDHQEEVCHLLQQFDKCLKHLEAAPDEQGVEGTDHHKRSCSHDGLSVSQCSPGEDLDPL